MIWRGQADGQTVEADDGRGEAWTQGRLHRAPIWAGGWGLILSDETDQLLMAGDPSLYGRDCAGMLGDYAADYAASGLFTPRKSALYGIDCRRIAG